MNRHRIHLLIAEIRSLRDQLDEIEAVLSNCRQAVVRESRQAKSVRSLLNDANYRLQQRECQDMDRQAALRELEQARRYNNEYRERQALDKLRRL